jgi:hypothetical protein
MRYLSLLLIVAIGSACSRPVEKDAAAAKPVQANNPGPGVESRPVQPPAIHTWLDPEASWQIMSARSDFDAAEAAALAELDRTIGPYRNIMVMPREQYARQLAGPEVVVPRSARWRLEQQKRAAYAYSIAEPKIDRARAVLARSTLAALASFFRRELKEGRIARSDYLRYTVETRRGYFPGFRGRKWSGPEVYEFRGADVSPEYQKVLQEVRRLWQAQGRARSAVVSGPTDPGFYRAMVPTK